MVTLFLSEADARFLGEQLGRQADHLENELVHTDKREMQRELAQEVERLRGILAKIEATCPS
jgi:hypothetical protein